MILRAMSSNIHSLFYSERSIQMFFTINGTNWRVQYENSNSGELKRSDNVSVLGVTDRNTHTIYLSNALRGFMERKVLIHEVCHAICMSYDVYLPIEQEEILCDFVATYGDEVFDIVDMVLGVVRRVG
jgi:hypothetical protein